MGLLEVASGDLVPRPPSQGRCGIGQRQAGNINISLILNSPCRPERPPLTVIARPLRNEGAEAIHCSDAIARHCEEERRSNPFLLLLTIFLPPKNGSQNYCRWYFLHQLPQPFPTPPESPVLYTEPQTKPIPAYVPDCTDVRKFQDVQHK